MLDVDDDPIRRLRDALGMFATGVAVISVLDGKGRATGITVNSFSALSLDPQLVLFSVGKEQVSCRWFEDCAHFNVNVLSAGQEALAYQFARPVKDKFEGVAQHADGNGVPVIADTLATFHCRKWQIMEGGDHWIIVGEVEDFSVREGEPLLFYRGKMRRIGD